MLYLAEKYQRFIPSDVRPFLPPVCEVFFYPPFELWHFFLREIRQLDCELSFVRLPERKSTRVYESRFASSLNSQDVFDLIPNTHPHI